MKSEKDRIKELTKILNRASEAYYVEGSEIISNLEYDRLYDELIKLEEKTKIVFSESPTQNVGYEVLSELPKERHPEKMLSLAKTKEREELALWLGNRKGLLSWKLDGLTIVLTYEDGQLVKAVTRGNGEIGEVVTNNAKVFGNVPIKIAHKGRCVLRGEAVITYKDFEIINEKIPGVEAKYKNPRNLCSGSVRQLDSRITKERNVSFFAFSLVSAEGVDFTYRHEQMQWLENQGFDIVTAVSVTAENIVEEVEKFEKEVSNNQVPSDGLVLIYDDIEYSRSLGRTAKYPRDAIAFKWQDEQAETSIREIEWNASRTGLINPVAIFEPVELEGTTVSRASLHNISIMKELQLGVGDRVMVYKANMIIPQIAENLTRSGNVVIPEKCPVCNMSSHVNDNDGVETLRCENPDCPAKLIKSFSLFVSRDAMNIEGLSEQTLEKFVNAGFIKSFADIFRLAEKGDEIKEMEGFGEKSFKKLSDAIEGARTPTARGFIYSLGIPGIGTANAALVAEHCRNSVEKIIGLGEEELKEIDGIGDVLAEDYVKYFADEKKAAAVKDLLAEITVDESFEDKGAKLQDLTFVITGKLKHYGNRKELKSLIEQQGGKVAGSVSGKTDYLINNDLESTTGKNKKAKELGVPIIDEEEIITMLK